MSWSTPFKGPIDLPNGRKVVTLRDAATYITKLPKAEHAAAPEWQAAMEALILVAENGGPTANSIRTAKRRIGQAEAKAG